MVALLMMTLAPLVRGLPVTKNPGLLSVPSSVILKCSASSYLSFDAYYLSLIEPSKFMTTRDRKL